MYDKKKYAEPNNEKIFAYDLVAGEETKRTKVTVSRRIGLTLILLGIVLGLFSVYQLFGTGLITAREQSKLDATIKTDEAIVENVAAISRAFSTTTSYFCPEGFTLDTHQQVCTSTTDTTELVEVETVNETTSSRYENMTAEELSQVANLVWKQEGEAIGSIRIPAIDLRWNFVEGISVNDLRKGPGHYPNTPLPGMGGNSAIAGHRTTYGAPFGDIAEISWGDSIFIHATYGDFEYRVIDRFVISPDEMWVIEDQGDNRLTLTSCHPKFSSNQRYVVVAELVSDTAAYIPSQEEIDELIANTMETTTETSVETHLISSQKQITFDAEKTTESVPCEDCEQLLSVEIQESANTIGSSGLGGNKKVTAKVIVWSVISLVWIIVAVRFFTLVSSKKMKFLLLLSPVPSLTVAFYFIDLWLPAY
ncbi:MAG: class E sortase [Acidimicrobiales bacterium]|jgi:LPXTG-site transpeptidase (sortase) family protein|nr:class E sortase [Acidimicrobiales bacterium]